MSRNEIEQFQLFEAKNRKEWYDWLKVNHKTSPGIWLVYYKKNSNKPTISYEEAVEVALIFGWIDSKVNALDDERYKQVFTPRKPGSIWSKLNKARVKRLVEQGLMDYSGLKKVEQAKVDGSWNFLDDIENLNIPDDLKVAFSSNKIAKNNFDAFANSNKKQILYWIKSAKREETRRNRIEKTVKLAAENKKPL